MRTTRLREWRGRLSPLLLAGAIAAGTADRGASDPAPAVFPNVPRDYLREADNPPDFWVSTEEGVADFLAERVHQGTVAKIGESAGGRPIRAVFYGAARNGRGTTTFSGAVGAGRMRAYFGPDFDKKVYWVMAAVHGGEFEGIVGLVNLLSVLETGKDLRARPWPGIVAAAAHIDRIIVIPIVNMDGRARVPLRMEAFRGTDNRIPEYLNTGGWPNGELIGWPACKQYIPLDFSKTQFPGGYPNDNGVNIMHDDFFGKRQPETQALFDLAARERPDLILNLHTGAGANDYYTRMHRPVMEDALVPAFNGLYRAVHTALVRAGMQGSNDLSVEAEPPLKTSYGYNLDTALDFHCGVLSVVVESPSHGYAGKNQRGDVVRQSADQLLDAELTVQEEAMKYLVDAGGRARWAGGK
jgi:Zinc carboxypeptidase